MTAEEVIAKLEALGGETTKRTLMRHGCREPLFGVKVGDLQPLRKVIKKDHALSLTLFETGIYDAQYLAGLIADEKRISADELRRWLAVSNCQAIRSSAVAWIAAESPSGWDLAREWIPSGDEPTAATGWNVASGWIALQPDAALDLVELERLLEHVETSIHAERNAVRYAMNHFVISLGIYVAPLTEKALAAGERIGAVSVDVGDTGCVVPLISPYIAKAQARGAIGRKRKMARC